MVTIKTERFNLGPRGKVGVAGPQGPIGWTPLYAVATDGSRKVIEITSWVGGEGTAPDVGYLGPGPSGIVADIADATDIRGETTLEADRRIYARIEDDFFMRTQSNFLHGAIVSGVNTGTAVQAANHPGVVLLRSGSGANSGYRYYTDPEGIIIGGGENVDIIFRTPNTMSNVIIRMGLHDTADENDAVDGLYFEMSGNLNIIGKTSNNSTRSSTANLGALGAEEWYHAQIAVNSAAGEVTFTIYEESGAQVGTATLSSNIPTSRACGVGIVATHTTASVVDLMQLDFARFALSRALVRGADINEGWM